MLPNQRSQLPSVIQLIKEISKINGSSNCNGVLFLGRRGEDLVKKTISESLEEVKR